jgi:hypothetical protein
MGGGGDNIGEWDSWPEEDVEENVEEQDSGDESDDNEVVKQKKAPLTPMKAVDSSPKSTPRSAKPGTRGFRRNATALNVSETFVVMTWLIL